MPIRALRKSKRAVAAISAFMATLLAGGYGIYNAQDRTVVINGMKIDVPVVMAAELIVKNWEGLVLTAHWDRFAKIYDICYGKTTVDGKPVKPGMSFTKKQCVDMLMVDLQKNYYEPIVSCAPPLKKAPDTVAASMTSGAYNFGVGGWCKWSMSAAIRRQDWRGACEAQTKINHSGGQFVEGLANRREMGDAYRIGEGELCVSGL